RCRRTRTKASRPATPENPDLWGNRKRQVLPRIRPGVPIRAAARARPVRALVRVAVPRLTALLASARCAARYKRGPASRFSKCRPSYDRDAHFIGSANDATMIAAATRGTRLG